MALPATDDFESAFNTTNWQQAFTLAVSTSAGEAIGNASGSAAAFWKSSVDAVDADQYSQAEIAWTGDGYGGVGVRMGGSVDSLTGYTFQAYSGSGSIEKWTGGSGSALGAAVSQAWSTGDMMRLEVSGTSTTTISLYRADAATPTEFTLLASREDSSSPYTSGQPGISFYLVGKLEAWEGGNLSAGSTYTPRSMLLGVG